MMNLKKAGKMKRMMITKKLLQKSLSRIKIDSFIYLTINDIINGKCYI